MGADVNEVMRMFASCQMFLGNRTVHETASCVSIRHNMFPVEFALFPVMSCFRKINNVQLELHIF
jgi:hypothetical protein